MTLAERITPNNITIEDAKFVYSTNFAGKEGPYNREGERSFNVAIPENLIEPLQADGWNIKFTKGTDEYPEEPYLPVEVGFKYRPPEIVLIQEGKKTFISEPMAGILDSTEFESFDIVIRPYMYDVNGNKGVKAYLKTFYGNVPSDPIQAKYRDLD